MCVCVSVCVCVSTSTACALVTGSAVTLSQTCFFKQVGYLPALLTAVLRPPLDAGLVRYSCQVDDVQPARAQDDIPVTLIAWGKDENSFEDPRLHALCYSFCTYTPLDARAALSRESLTSKRAVDLKELLVARGLPSSGNKVNFSHFKLV